MSCPCVISLIKKIKTKQKSKAKNQNNPPPQTPKQTNTKHHCSSLSKERSLGHTLERLTFAHSLTAKRSKSHKTRYVCGGT